jgi:prepilin-type N-terminal cleavage/methylation domain-containing protein
MHTPTQHRKPGAFTLVELLVVVAIITILAAILVPTISKTQQTAKEKGTLGMIRRVEMACARYYQDIGIYPGDGSEIYTGTSHGLYLALTMDYNHDGVVNEADGFGTATPYIEITDVDTTRRHTGEYVIGDRWGSEIGYDELELSNFDTQNGRFSHLSLTYDDPRDSSATATWAKKEISLWSPGNDGRTSSGGGEGAANNVDNIVNW